MALPKPGGKRIGMNTGLLFAVVIVAGIMVLMLGGAIIYIFKSLGDLLFNTGLSETFPLPMAIIILVILFIVLRTRRKEPGRY